MIHRDTEIKIYHNKKKGWMIETPIALRRREIYKAIQKAIHTYFKKYNSMDDGQEKERFAKSITELRSGNITQLVRNSGEVILWR